MRNELNNIELIEKYASDEMTSAEKSSFEEQLQNNPSLADQLASYQLFQQATVRKSIKADIAKYAPSSTFAWAKWLGIIGGGIGIAILFYYLFNIYNTKDQLSEYQSNNNDQIETITPISDHLTETTDSKESDSTSDELIVDIKNIEEKETDNSNPKSDNPISNDYLYDEDTHCGGLNMWVTPEKQHHTINPSNGATIEGQEGTLVIVPTDAFVDLEGYLIKEDVSLEIVEALKPSDMIAYNLTTMNDGNLLESGGMIYLQPRVGDKEVFINPDRPLYIEIPTEKYNPDMKSWEGKVDENGNINWKNPKDLKKYLTVVDFDNLDLLPDGFDIAVEAGMPFKNHQSADEQLVDSLYYNLIISPSKEFDCNALDSENYFEGKIIDGKSNNNLLVKLIEVKENAFVEIRAYGNPVKSGTTNSEGEVSFNNILTGNYQLKVCADGNVTYINNLKVNKGNNSKSFNYNFYGINLESKDYKNSNSKLVSNTTPLKAPINSEEKSESTCHISPSSILAIQADDFSQTYLATKEFEQRLNYLHEMNEGQRLFDIYVNNLSKDLWEVDQMVADELKGNEKQIFEDFAKLKLTNTKASENIYQDQLSSFYNTKRSEIKTVVKKAAASYNEKNYAELNALKNQMDKVQQDYSKWTTSYNNGMAQLQAKNTKNQSSSTFKSRNWKPNLNLNLSLPRNNNTSATSRNTYSTVWYQTGWMNIDAYLHLLGSDPYTMEIEVSEEEVKRGAKVYQFLNTLKTVIPITIAGVIGKVKFPKNGTKGSAAMKNTFSIGISRKDGKIMYAEEYYNPYSRKTLPLNWNEVTEDELMDNLKKLDGTTPLLKQLKNEQKVIDHQLLVKQKKEAFDEEMQALKGQVKEEEQRILKEENFLNSLRKVINQCWDGNYKSVIENKVKREEVIKDNSPEQVSLVSFWEETPSFPGGQSKLYDFLAENLEYPQEAKEQGINGKSYIKFTVEIDGSITNINMVKSSHPLLDQAAIDAVKQMPNWIPKTENNKSVQAEYVLPINFSLN